MLKSAFLSLVLGSLALSGQWGGGTSERRAEIRGGGGDSGKCTIEVEVDGVAEVAINGDLGRLRTVSGNPASWRRFQCTSIMPGNPSDFRFKGIDGRGRQELINDPRGRGGAMIRIDDPKGGSESYTFDIEWRGVGSGTGSGSGWGSGGSGGSGGGWGSGGSGSGWGGSGGSGWSGSNDFSYSGRGSGTFNNANGNNDRLRSANVRINRNGNVEVGFETDRNGFVTLRGRVTRSQSDRVEAAVSGNGIAGDMTIYTSGANRVREIRMSGINPVRFDLRWRE